MMKPKPGTYPPYYDQYINLVKQDNVNAALEQSMKDIVAFASAIPADKEEYRYGPDKWSIREVFTHIADSERILSYRALRFARRDPAQPLPFDEKEYARHSLASQRSLKSIIEEMKAVRYATQLLYQQFDEPTLQMPGNTKMGDTTVLAIGFMICGHGLHHTNVVRERYMK